LWKKISSRTIGNQIKAVAATLFSEIISLNVLTKIAVVSIVGKQAYK